MVEGEGARPAEPGGQRGRRPSPRPGRAPGRGAWVSAVPPVDRVRHGDRLFGARRDGLPVGRGRQSSRTGRVGRDGVGEDGCPVPARSTRGRVAHGWRRGRVPGRNSRRPRARSSFELRVHETPAGGRTVRRPRPAAAALGSSLLGPGSGSLTPLAADSVGEPNATDRRRARAAPPSRGCGGPPPRGRARKSPHLSHCFRGPGAPHGGQLRGRTPGCPPRGFRPRRWRCGCGARTARRSRGPTTRCPAGRGRRAAR